MSFDLSYTQTTDFVKVVVFPIYLESQSSPEENHYLWAYHVRIENLGRETIQLRTRHWIITDAYGRQQEIHGSGVIGEHPVIKPGAVFEYTSGTPLSTPSGVMMGHYEMAKLNGEIFLVDIPAFSLDSPHQPVILN